MQNNEHEKKKILEELDAEIASKKKQLVDLEESIQQKMKIAKDWSNCMHHLSSALKNLSFVARQPDSREVFQFLINEGKKSQNSTGDTNISRKKSQNSTGDDTNISRKKPKIDETAAPKKQKKTTQKKSNTASSPAVFTDVSMLNDVSQGKVVLYQASSTPSSQNLEQKHEGSKLNKAVRMTAEEQLLLAIRTCLYNKLNEWRTITDLIIDLNIQYPEILINEDSLKCFLKQRNNYKQLENAMGVENDTNAKGKEFLAQFTHRCQLDDKDVYYHSIQIYSNVNGREYLHCISESSVVPSFKS